LWPYHIKVDFIVQFNEELSCGLENICKLKIIEREKSFQQPSIDNINVFHKMKTTTMFKIVKQVFQLLKNLLLYSPL